MVNYCIFQKLPIGALVSFLDNMAGLKKILAGLVTGHNWLLPALLYSTASVWFYWLLAQGSELLTEP
jgi:hypothetical protein